MNIHSAATNIKWYGTGFNPAQADFAQDVAKSLALAHLSR